MEYQQEFQLDFMRRTLAIVRGYNEPYDATLLVNCLLGLLIVPKERWITRIPADPLSRLPDWGISPNAVKSFGKCPTCGSPRSENLRELVWSMRNAIAHFRLAPFGRSGHVAGFKLTDRNGFEADIELHEMRAFVEKLAEHLEREMSLVG
jgi:HEPN pEK499 p136